MPHGSSSMSFWLRTAATGIFVPSRPGAVPRGIARLGLGLRPGEVARSSSQPLAEPVCVDQYPPADPHHASIKPGLSSPPDLPAETVFGKMREFVGSWVVSYLIDHGDRRWKNGIQWDRFRFGVSSRPQDKYRNDANYSQLFLFLYYIYSSVMQSSKHRGESQSTHYSLGYRSRDSRRTLARIPSAHLKDILRLLHMAVAKRGGKRWVNRPRPWRRSGVRRRG